jgi:hypothetical protein
MECIPNAILIAACPADAKAKCRKEADFRMKNANKTWCIDSDGNNMCKDEILNGAALCLDACGDTGAFDRLGNIQSKHHGSGGGQGGGCGGGEMCGPKN